jgi:hypothetical protein
MSAPKRTEQRVGILLSARKRDVLLHNVDYPVFYDATGLVNINDLAFS